MSATTEFDREFDYVIIGAGTAGCVLASRLSEDSANRVCLIEAGGSERHPFIAIPAAVGCAIMSRKFGWGFTTVPQPHLHGRQVPLPRGRVIGGTGSINGMAYFRGPALDYDDWAAMGNPGWSYADLLPYFLRSEHNPEYAGSPYHATGGPMGVSFPTSRNPLCDAFNASVASLGYKELADFNDPDPNGYGYRQGTIWNGFRVSTASAYLRPAMTRRNLEVLSNTRVRRVLFDGKLAVGVELQTQDGIKRFRARKEIIVAAGTFHSPHVLLNSGVGDERDLKSWGVTPVQHLPAVGRNLRDHPAAPIAMETDDSTSYGHSWKALPRNVTQGFRYLATQLDSVDSPDLYMSLAITKTTFENYNFYFSGGGWYYPWASYGMYTTTYETGSLLMEMIETSRIDTTNPEIPAVWAGMVQGIIEESKNNNIERLTKNIDQCFIQSPYLTKDNQ